MKMVKKILLGTLAVAAILSIASCKREEGGNSSIIDVKAASSSASIDKTNDGDSVTRGFKTLQTKHLDAICHIETTVTDLVDKTVNGNKILSSGTMGYIFNLVKNEETNKYSFTIAGARHNKVAGTIEAYVESFKDVAADKLEEQLDGGVKATGLTYGSDDFGFTLVTKAQLDAMLNGQTSTPKKLDLWIDVVANGQEMKNNTLVDAAGRDGTAAGTYTVTFYWKDPKRKSSATSYDLHYVDGNSAAPTTFEDGWLKSCTVAAANVNAPYNAEKGLTSMQSDVGFYANVYAGQTLKGTWEFSEIKKEAEEIEE